MQPSINLTLTVFMSPRNVQRTNKKGRGASRQTCYLITTGLER